MQRPLKHAFAFAVTLAALIFSNVGCGEGGNSSATVSTTPAGDSPVRVSGKVGILTVDKANPWIAKQLEVVSSSPYFTGGMLVKKASNSATAITAIDELAKAGCTLLVLLLPPETLDGSAVMKVANDHKLKTAALHWRVYGSDGTVLPVPFVGIHENQAADSLAQTAIKAPDLGGVKCLYVGRVEQHPDFFERADATLNSKIDAKHPVKCDVAENLELEAYKVPVQKSVGKDVKSTWIVMGINDACALGAAKALKEAGAPRVLAYGVGGSDLAVKAWDSNAPYGLDASILLNPFPEVRILAKSLAKWESSGSPFNDSKVGGTVIQKGNYKDQIKGTVMASEADKS